MRLRIHSLCHPGEPWDIDWPVGYPFPRAGEIFTIPVGTFKVLQVYHFMYRPTPVTVLEVTALDTPEVPAKFPQFHLDQEER